MASPVGRIEKEFLLKIIFDEHLPVIFMKDRTEFVLKLEQPAGEEMVFRSESPMEKLKPHLKIHLLFDYRGQVIDFNTEVTSQIEDLISCKTPETFYKNLDRDYLRVDAPSDLKIRFSFQGARYNLSFPKIAEYENMAMEEVVRNLDPRNLPGLIKQITSSINKFADGYKIINFKDKKPETLEERVVSETGKTLFIPSTSGYLPKTDPYPRKRIITEDLFKRYLESTGVGTTFLNDRCTRFLKNKYEDGIYSDAWVPIIFHEYVIGYIHIWIGNNARPPFDFNVLDAVYQFSKVLAFSLKENGYFEHGRVYNEPFEGKVLDISASGLLFACPLGATLLTTLLVDTDLIVILEASNRILEITARIVRRFKDRTAGYFGCRFVDMAPEDMRFLFEHLYGKHIDDNDLSFISSRQV